MNTETTVLAAIVLAIIIIAAVFAAVQGSVLRGGDAVDNISGGTEKDDDGDYSFTSLSEHKENKPSEPIKKEEVRKII